MLFGLAASRLGGTLRPPATECKEQTLDKRQATPGCRQTTSSSSTPLAHPPASLHLSAGNRGPTRFPRREGRTKHPSTNVLPAPRPAAAAPEESVAGRLPRQNWQTRARPAGQLRPQGYLCNSPRLHWWRQSWNSCGPDASAWGRHSLLPCRSERRQAQAATRRGRGGRRVPLPRPQRQRSHNREGGKRAAAWRTKSVVAPAPPIGTEDLRPIWEEAVGVHCRSPNDRSQNVCGTAKAENAARTPRDGCTAQRRADMTLCSVDAPPQEGCCPGDARMPVRRSKKSLLWATRRAAISPTLTPESRANLHGRSRPRFPKPARAPGPAPQRAAPRWRTLSSTVLCVLLRGCLTRSSWVSAVWGSLLHNRIRPIRLAVHARDRQRLGVGRAETQVGHRSEFGRPRPGCGRTRLAIGQSLVGPILAEIGQFQPNLRRKRVHRSNVDRNLSIFG